MQNLFITLSTLNERNELSDNRIINSGFHIILGQTTSDAKMEWKREIRVNTNTHVDSIVKNYSSTILAKTCLRGGSILYASPLAQFACGPNLFHFVFCVRYLPSGIMNNILIR